MADSAVPVSLIVMTGVLLVVVAWQILGMVREHARRGDPGGSADIEDLRRRIEALEQMTST